MRRKTRSRAFTCVAMLVIALITQRGYSALKDLKWVGGTANDDFQTAANWSPAETPSYDHRLIFENDATPCIITADKAYAGQIVVREGCQVTVTTTQSNGRCILKEGNAGSEQVVVDVANGATLTFNAGLPNLFSASAGNPTFVKLGGGTFSITGQIQNDLVCDVREGVMEAADSMLNQDGRITIASGAVFRLLADNKVSDTAVCDIAAGGVLDLNGKTDSIGGICGEGLVKNGTLTLTLCKGPYSFGGTTEDLYLTVKRYGTTYRAATEEQFGLILTSSDALANLKGVVTYTYDSGLTDPALKDSRNSWLRFAPGIGFFVVATNSATTLLGYLAHPLNLEDLDGNPVTLNVRLSQDGINALSTTGKGNLLIAGYSPTLSGNHLAHTGTIGAATAGQTLTFGTGSVAADFDFSKSGGLVAEPGNVIVGNSEVVQIRGVVKGSGDITFRSATTVSDYRVTGAAASVEKTLVINGGSAWTRYHPGFSFDAANARLVVNAGEVGAARSVNDKEAMGDGPVPTGMLLSGEHQLSATVEQNGGDVWVRGPAGYGVKTFELNGGRLHIPAFPYGPVAGSTAANPTVFSFNGGAILFSRRTLESYIGMTPFEDTDAIVLKVGAGGATIADEHVFSRCSSFATAVSFNRPFVSGVSSGVDGGVTQRGFYEFSYKYPFAITGPFVGEGGSSMVPATADISSSPSWFGAGDTILRNHYLKLEVRNSAYSFCPHGAGKKLIVGGGAGLVLRDTLDKGSVDMTINALEFEPGGALFINDRGGIGTDAAASKVKLASPPPVAANGRVQMPVFTTVNGVGRSAVLLGYDQDCGFTNLVSGSTFGEGKVVELAYDTTIPAGQHWKADALMFDSGVNMTLRDGSSLAIGDGVTTGLLLLNHGGIEGASDASVSFGTSEGMIVCGVNGAAEECQTKLLVPISAANGLSVVSVPDIVRAGWRGVRLSCANTYSGVTRIGSAIVQAEHPGCFSSGDVYVSGGDRHGGGVRFKCAGGEWANGFHIAGRGIRRQSLDGTSAEAGFAMEFSQSGKVSGPVEINGLARMIALEGATGEIAGVVSGGKLELLYSDGAVRLSNDNTYSGGTDVILSALELGNANSAGTGRIWLSSGTLRFVNTEPITFANRIEGVGKIEIAGAPVTFVHDEFGAFAGRTFSKGTTLDFPNFAEATVKTAVVLDGGTFKVGAEGLTVSELWGEGTVAGGALTVTGSVNPSGAVTFATQPALDGATLVVETENGLVGKIVVPEDLDVSTLAVEVVQRGTPVAFSAAFLESAGTLSGSFVTVSLPEKKRKNYSVSVGASVATLNYAKPGVVLLVR